MDEGGQREFWLTPGHSEGGTSMPVDGHKASISVRAVGAGVYPKALLGDRPFGAKVDVEGAEPVVLPGLISIPGFRFVVFETVHLGTRKAQVWDMLRDHGLATYGIVKTLLRLRFRRIDRPEAFHKHQDAVAFRVNGTAPLARRIGLERLKRLNTLTV